MSGDATRRAFLGAAAAGAALGPALAARGDADPPPPITDTHQHLWERSRFTLPWLEGAGAVLRRDFTPADYAQATRGLGVVRTVYMEVDVRPDQHVAEAEFVIGLCRDGRGPMVGAVIGGRPAAPDFADYLARFRGVKEVKGVRQVLHGGTPRGYCLEPEFVRGIRALGAAGLSFDLCLRPAELDDARALAERCPDTRFILDHCGNADVTAFGANPAAPPSHDPDAWRRAIDGLAKRDNVACKISGIVAKAPAGWTPATLAPVVDHCLDAFGPDRVVFGGDWPVCLLGAPLAGWVAALRAIVARRPAADQLKLFHANATRVYRLDPA
jgi:L-fuconolactonase